MCYKLRNFITSWEIVGMVLLKKNWVFHLRICILSSQSGGAGKETVPADTYFIMDDSRQLWLCTTTSNASKQIYFNKKYMYISYTYDLIIYIYICTHMSIYIYKSYFRTVGFQPGSNQISTCFVSFLAQNCEDWYPGLFGNAGNEQFGHVGLRISTWSQFGFSMP